MYTRNLRKKEKGFTLIEMLVSIALFSVVLTVTLGTIVTIADSNKKARSLMSVMGNLNFAVDGITRSIKTGYGVGTSNGSSCVSTSQINYSTPSDLFDTETVEYCWVVTNGVGTIMKTVGGTSLPLTSPDVDIDYLEFSEFGTAAGDQPRIVIKMEGTVQVSPRVSSNFTIQTTVSQRTLNVGS